LVEVAPNEISKDSVNCDNIDRSENCLQIFAAAILIFWWALSIKDWSSRIAHIWLIFWSFIFKNTIQLIYS
jgi:hypothetical protein